MIGSRSTTFDNTSIAGCDENGPVGWFFTLAPLRESAFLRLGLLEKHLLLH